MDNELVNFEAHLKELAQTIERMEKGDLTLEASLTHFERGITLAKHCQQALTKAEQQVEMLLTKNGQTELVDFNPPADE